MIEESIKKILLEIEKDNAVDSNGELREMAREIFGLAASPAV